MAQKIQTLFIDDLDGSEAEGTVRFGLDGVVTIGLRQRGRKAVGIEPRTQRRVGFRLLRLFRASRSG
jgi:hypothetical protein